jgi:type IV pilus assembly protein PilA
MLATLRKRFARDDEEGFTLIELMVVVLIIAILLAIAIPTFLGARERAQDRAAQSDLRNTLTAEKVHYTDNQVYTTNLTAIKSIEPSLTYTAGSGDKNDVGLRANDTAATDANTIVCVSKQSKSGTHFSLIDVATGPAAGTYYAKVTCPSVTAVAPSSLSAPSAGTVSIASTSFKSGGW